MVFTSEMCWTPCVWSHKRYCNMWLMGVSHCFIFFNISYCLFLPLGFICENCICCEANTKTRELTLGEKQAILKLREEGKPIRAIAQPLGIVKTIIENVLNTTTTNWCIEHPTGWSRVAIAVDDRKMLRAAMNTSNTFGGCCICSRNWHVPKYKLLNPQPEKHFQHFFFEALTLVIQNVNALLLPNWRNTDLYFKVQLKPFSCKTPRHGLVFHLCKCKVREAFLPQLTLRLGRVSRCFSWNSCAVLQWHNMEFLTYSQTGRRLAESLEEMTGWFVWVIPSLYCYITDKD